MKRPKTAPPTIWSSGVTSTDTETVCVPSFGSPPSEEEGYPLHGRKDQLVRPSTSAASSGPEGNDVDIDRVRRQGLEGGDGKGSEEGVREGGDIVGKAELLIGQFPAVDARRVLLLRCPQWFIVHG